VGAIVSFDTLIHVAGPMTRPSSLAGNAGAAAARPLLHALSAFQQGRAADCAKLCESILAKRAREPGALHLLGAARLRLGDSEGALGALRQAARYDPRNAEIHSNLGAALRAAGDAAAAVESLRRAVALNPDAAPALYNLGNALAELGQHEEAVAAYRKAAALSPADAAVHNNFGLALAALGRHDEAIAAWPGGAVSA
jgi:Flp pilus assembly protein TadD